MNQKQSKVSYIYQPGHHQASEPDKYSPSELTSEEMLLSMGPQHPSTHGVMRLEVITEGEVIADVVPHLGYLHRCFEKHCEHLPFNQIIPFVDRLDYVASMNNEHAYVMGVEKMLGIDPLPKRTEYIRVLVAELNRLASHFIALGTYAIDVGVFSPFLWLMRDREHILRLLEWVSGSRLLYNYMWVGGLFYDLPVGFEEQCTELLNHIDRKLPEFESTVLNNPIFIDRTANIGAAPLPLALDCGVTGPLLRACGLARDLRRTDNYSVYNEIDFDVPIGQGEMGTVGDCWDRTFVRYRECIESVRIVRQCIFKLQGEHRRTVDYNPHEFLPKKIRPAAGHWYARAENPKGELGFYFVTDGRSDIPVRCKARGASFCNLSLLPHIAKGFLVADLVAIVGSLDFVMAEVDR